MQSETQQSGSMTNQPGVTDNTTLHQFELVEDGHMALARYRRQANVVAVHHVEADPALRGKGTASRLMDGIVGIARAQSLSIQPTCAYAKDWFSKHPQAADVLS